jgi:hypothetical protein
MKPLAPLIFSVALLWSCQALACKCVATPLGERLANAEVALVADVVTPHANPDEYGSATLRVVRTLKGVVAAGTLISLNPSSGTSCAGWLPRNARILFFARDDIANKFSASKCSLFLASPITVDGEQYEPAEDVVQFLDSQAARPN